ncbi:RNA polymerase sigma factor SigJ [Cohnella zeiphila]|uniref:RNA polymerase sigma factor SigJ n=1 Tax=Cohnella zeiphila TaxID=2761120 RepID=A0A7X0SP01_9BACL|nr:RNA polymerase sigma factor SigJ [Cohnella zeiphila]MBB6733361.1 RNA polymerase sigma factor SigJ [Cohnella zeiphila]
MENQWEDRTASPGGAEGTGDIELWYREYRPYLFTIAYRMLGTVSDAEDIVQDLFLSLSAAAAAPGGEPIRREKAYLARMAVNRCLNFLNSAAKRRETYVGPWLPEPLVDTANPLPPDAAERGEAVSYAFMVLLERLAPAERAVFVLRETMGYEYAEIASLVGKSEANCRQLFSRARRKLDAERSEETKPMAGRELVLVRRFVAAFRGGRADELVRLLADDAVMFTDGGGKVRAAINPIYGPDRVEKLLSRIAFSRLHTSRLTEVPIAGGIGLAAWDEDRLTAFFCFEWSEGDEHGNRALRRIYNLFNPDKLAGVRLALPSPGPAQS